MEPHNGFLQMYQSKKCQFWFMRILKTFNFKNIIFIIIKW